jgi:hypothetical protein
MSWQDSFKKIFILSLLAVTFIWVSTAIAVQPADNAIKSAANDLSRYEKQLTGRQVSKNSARRNLKLLKLTRQRLNSSTNKTHASWIETEKRLTQLETQLQAIVSGAIVSETTVSGTNEKPAPVASQAASTPASTASQVIFAPTGKKPAQMISHQRVKVNKLRRDIVSTRDTIDKGGIKPFQNPDYVNKYQKLAELFSNSLARYDAYKTDPDVIATAKALQYYKNMLAFGQAEGKKAVNQLGDVQKRLHDMDNNFPRAPKSPPLPYQSSDIADWNKAAEQAEKTIKVYMKSLTELKNKAYLPLTRGSISQGAAYDFQDVDRLISNLHRSQRDIHEIRIKLQGNLNAQLREVDRILKFINSLDPKNDHHVKNNFLNEGAQEQKHQQLDDIRTIVEAVMAYEKQSGEIKPETKKRLAQIDQAKQNYNKKRASALKSLRMPKAASNSAELKKIAKETLVRPKYGVGNIKRLVINSDKVKREKQTSDTEIDNIEAYGGKLTLSGKTTTYHYVWEEFQVTTAEPFNGKYYLYYNTLKYFTKGAATTPLNQWILSGRIKGTEILEKNINR